MKLPYQIVIPCLLMALAAGAQDKSKVTVRTQDKSDHLNYSKAIELYQQGDSSFENIEYIANSYRLNGDSWNAARWYALLIDDNTRPINYLYYAQALQSNGELEKAKIYYLKYNQMMGYSLNPDRRGLYQVEAIENSEEFSSLADVNVKNEWIINSEKLDFSPSFYKNGIVFVTNRSTDKSQKDAWTGDDFTSLYFVSVDETGQVGVPEAFNFSANASFHNGPVSFSPDGEIAFFTKSMAPKGKKRLQNQEWSLKIFSTQRLNMNWSEPAPVNLANESSNDVHPALSPDGMSLYFASDRPGGFGGMDLYVVKFRGGKWGHPINLGSTINTPGNEVFPFVCADDALVFASDGWGGLGGLDIFYALNSGDGSFENAENLGRPFNSPQDDFGLILSPSGKDGYFSSGREGGRGKDDIYRFTTQAPIIFKKNIPQPDMQGNVNPPPVGLSGR